MSYLQEFFDSAIALDVAQANTTYLEGSEALEALLADAITSRQKNQSYLTTGSAGLARFYSFIEAGAWFATPENEAAAYAKPKAPRWDSERGRPIRYETAPGAEGVPLYPRLGAAVAGRWGVTCWADVLARPDIPVLVCEGWKKALASVSQGYPAVCLRGVTQWHPKGGRLLYPMLGQLATGGRLLAIAFDQDEKITSRSKVARQAQQLGSAIEKSGGKPRFMVWAAGQGKGLDDALGALPAEARPGWLAQQLGRALSPKEYRRVATIARSAEILQSGRPRADRATTGEYLPELPALTPGAVHWLSATMNSGKTYRMGQDWVRPWAEQNGITVVLSPLNSLGQQTGQDWGLPHIHDYGTDAASQQALQADISQSGGMVACLNSAHRVLALIPKDAALLLILDEAAQTLTDAAEGGTLKGDWAARWEDAIALMQRAATGGAIALAEDGLDIDTIRLVKSLSGAAAEVGISHRKALTPWACTIQRATPLSGYRGDLLGALQHGDRILYVTTSQKEGRRLERAATEAGISCVRIDSTTNEGGRHRAFFESPDPWLYQLLPQLLILTPSAKTGISIEGGISAAGAFFDSVWGYFPSLDTDTAMQLLGRYRPPVPRHIWAPAYISPDPGEGPGRATAAQGVEAEAAIYAAYGQFEQAPADSHDSAIRQYLAARRVRRWAQKVRAADALADALGAAGHRVEVISEGSTNKGITAQWREIDDRLAWDDSRLYASSEIDPGLHTLAWAEKIARGTDSTHEQRCKAAKVRMLARFPGIDWDSADVWYQAEFCPRHDATGDRPSQGPVAKGAARWAEADHYRALWAEDAAKAKGILGQRLRAAHLLPSQGPDSMLASTFKPLIGRLLAAGEVTPGGRWESEIKAKALGLAAELWRYWRIKVDEEQSDTAIANKLARKFGLVLARARRVTVGGKREWIYSIESTQVWRDLMAARGAALGGTNSLEQYLTSLYHPPISDPGISPPDLPPPPSGRVSEGASCHAAA